MIDYSEILEQVHNLRERKNTIEMVSRVDFPGFPFETMYKGQHDALVTLKKGEPCVVSSHTGSGKSAVFIAATIDEPTLIIEPRKFLQKQIAEYYVANNRRYAVVFGRSEYPCPYAGENGNAGIAPCLKKTKCTNTFYKDQCDEYSSICERKPCSVFMDGYEFHKYPCPDCAYFKAQAEAAACLRASGTVIGNFGNFWTLLDGAANIVIDEADLFFREIGTPRVINTAVDEDENIKQMLEREIDDIDRRMQTTTAKQYYALKNAKYSASFLLSNHELCFSYKKMNWKTREEKIYVEINPESVNILKDRIFKNKRVIIVTATPTNFDMPAITYEVPQRCGIFYAPQGKLTANELKTQPWILDNAITEFIAPMSNIFNAMYGSKKFVVHCGNLGQHAARAYSLLGADQCILHEKGQLMKTIETFMVSDKRYLLVASAEYGADFTWCDCQYILKFPYASKDDRMKALEKKMGKSKFKRWYTLDAINRLVQQSGRVGRGYDSFGCTFILDSKFRDVFRMYKNAFPEWFVQRLMS